MQRIDIKRAILLGLVVLVAFPGSIAWSGNLGRCVSAAIPSDIVLPNGSTYPASVLRICLTGNYSPVSGLHETWVGGNAVGMYFSKRGESEGLVPHARPYFQFQRLSDGRLELKAYAVPDGDRYATYEIRMIGKVKHPKTEKPDSSAVDALPAELDAGNVVLVAAAAVN